MAILRIKSVVATAEIAGLVRSVGYDEETKRLWIEAINADEALELLREMGRAGKALALGMSENEEEVLSILGVQASAEAASKAAKKEKGEEAVDPPKPSVAKKKKAPAKKADQPPEEDDEPKETATSSKKTSAPRRAVKSATVQDDIEQEASGGEPEPEPEPETVEEEEEEKPVASKGNGTSTGSEISPDLLGAKKLRDIVGILYDQGFKSQTDMIGRCTELQSHLTVLKRIKNLDERVARAMDVMGMLEG